MIIPIFILGLLISAQVLYVAIMKTDVVTLKSLLVVISILLFLSILAIQIYKISTPP